MPLQPSLTACCFRQHEGITSAILVGAQVIRHAADACQEELWGPFVAAAWPWTMWHHHAIRSHCLCACCSPTVVTPPELALQVTAGIHLGTSLTVHCLPPRILPTSHLLQQGSHLLRPPAHPATSNRFALRLQVEDQPNMCYLRHMLPLSKSCSACTPESVRMLLLSGYPQLVLFTLSQSCMTFPGVPLQDFCSAGAPSAAGGLSPSPT